MDLDYDGSHTTMSPVVFLSGVDEAQVNLGNGPEQVSLTYRLTHITHGVLENRARMTLRARPRTLVTTQNPPP